MGVEFPDIFHHRIARLCDVRRYVTVTSGWKVRVCPPFRWDVFQVEVPHWTSRSDHIKKHRESFPAVCRRGAPDRLCQINAVP